MQTQTRSQAPSPATTPERRWLALVVIAVAQLMVALDATIVNIALPTAQHDLGFSDANRALVVTAYTSTLAGLLLFGGRVGDRYGRRTAFLVGLTGFAAASALAGAAPDFAVLVAGRALQGAFAALLVPTALSLVATTFIDPRERAKAFGVYGAVASSGAAVGLLLGGILTEYAGWRWCLLVNVAVAAVTLAAGRAVLPASPGHAEQRIDAASGILATVGVAAVVVGCSQAATHGWSSVQVLGPGAAGVVALGLFVRRQHRTAHPLLPLWVLTDRTRVGAYIAVAAGVLASFGMFLMLTYQFQEVLGYSAVRTGLAFLPLTAAVSASSYGLGSRLMTRLPTVALVVPGLLVAASALLLLATMDAGSGYRTTMLPAELLLGLGMGLAMTPAIAASTSDVEPRYAGVVAATTQTSMQLGGSVGTVVLNSLAVAAATSYARVHGGAPAALVHGSAVATGWAGGMLIVAAVVVYLLLTTGRKAR